MTYAPANPSQRPILNELDEITLATELLEAQSEGELTDVLRRAAETARAMAQPGALRRAIHNRGPEVLGGLAAGYVRGHTGDEYMARTIGEGVADLTRRGLRWLGPEHKEMLEQYQTDPATALDLACRAVRRAASIGVARATRPSSGRAALRSMAAVPLAKGKYPQNAAFVAAGRALPPSPNATDAPALVQRIANGESIQHATLSVASERALRQVNHKARVADREVEFEIKGPGRRTPLNPRSRQDNCIACVAAYIKRLTDRSFTGTAEDLPEVKSNANVIYAKDYIRHNTGFQVMNQPYRWERHLLDIM